MNDQHLQVQELPFIAVAHQLHRLQLQRNAIIMQIYQAEMNRRRRRRRRRYWVRPWVMRRPDLGMYDQLMVELAREDTVAFTNFLRVEPVMFRELSDRLHGRLQKAVTRMRRPLEPSLKLAITLRYLATGDSYRSLMYAFRVAHNTISLVIREVCQAIIDEYGEEVVHCPDSPEEWLEVAESFSECWNFPHAIGALDGKHVAIKCPRASGSTFYNYKGFYSVVLFALVDADYKFLWCDVGAPGSNSDATIFLTSDLRACIEDGSIGLPDPQPLRFDDRVMPYFIIGDDAFPLQTWLMKPFSRLQLTDSERIFNYRLSRARRVVENAFGILSNRFRCMLTAMPQTTDCVRKIIQASVVLHNLMRIRYPRLQNNVADREDEDHNFIPGAWRTAEVEEQLQAPQVGGRASREAKRQRLYLQQYVNTVGAVPWQNNML